VKRSNDATSAAPAAGKSQRSPQLRFTLALASIWLLLLGGVSVAFADEGDPAPGSPAAEEEIFNSLKDAIESGNPQQSEASVNAALTDAQAAEELPHRELDRSEALELMRRVFGSQLQAPAGIFDDLEVEKFLSDYAAVIPAGGSPAPNGVVVGGEEKDPQEAHATLLESTTPLRAPDYLGHMQPVDLSLEPGDGELQPANPLVEVGVPQELGEGIDLPDAGIQIELAGAPQERAPSTLEQSVAAYPEVAKDTSLAVAPTPTGVETLTLLQSADAPRSETFHLDLSDGATLQPTEGGGAEVARAGETIVSIEAPTAIDAQGQPVPVSLEVSDDAITLQVFPGQAATFPILLDPVYDTFNWNGVSTSFGSWVATSYSPTFSAARSAYCSNTPGAVNQCGTPLTQNTPGLYSSATAGGSLATNAWVQQVYFVPRAGSDYSTYGVLPTSFIEGMTINHVGFWHRTDWAASPYMMAGIWAGAEAPAPGANPAGWTSLLTRGGNQEDLNETLQYTFPGNNNHNAKEALVGMMATEPHAMTAYRDSLFREVDISLGDVDKPGFVPITPPSEWMDQTAAPIGFTVTDSGLGVSSLTTADRQTPQHSWITARGCAGTNDNPCPHTWKSTDGGSPALKYEPSVLPNGTSSLDLTASDPVGNTAMASVPVKVDHTAPALSLSGSITEQATLGASRPRYVLKYNATDGSEEQPAVVSSFGSAGAGNGQLAHPADAAVDVNGNIWVADANNNRIEEFNEKGEFVKKFGILGSGNGQLNRPVALELDAKRNIWVADANNNRIEEFNEKGEYLTKFGSGGSGNGQFSNPEGIAIDAKGNIWVADTYHGRLQEFNEKGEFLKVVSSYGSGTGQLGEPTGIDTGPGGNVWVADWQNNRVAEFNEKGEFVRQFGSAGSGNGQFNRPDAIDVDTKGNVWVGDQNNGRIERFGETGAYLGQFGFKGSGSGQFSFGYPMGVTTNSAGTIWVTDTNNNRVEKWSAPKVTQSGVVSTTVKVDGKTVSSSTPGCSTGNCSMTGDWVLAASAYSPGAHAVAVMATDGVGHTTTKELTINVQLDTTKPTLGMGGEVQEAPDSWVTQRNYTFYVGASDGGYGVTKVQILVDGKAASGGIAEQSCADGGCSLNHTFTINMAAYSGGEHTASVVVIDGAGNKTEVSNPFRIDPSGKVTAAEATATLEAVEVTSGESFIDPSISPAELEDEDREVPTLKVVGDNVESIGTAVTSAMPIAGTGGITFDSPDGAVQIEPSLQNPEATPLEIVGKGASGVSGNTGTATDAAIRPLYDGILSFGAIRSAEAPEEYSWTVELPKGQHLKEVSSQTAEVYYEDESSAMAITSEGAHDATGAEVPTVLKVSGGDVITLAVKHRPAQGQAGYVYPIVAGAGFQTGYDTVRATPAPEALEDFVRRQYAEFQQREKEAQEARELLMKEENDILEREIEELEREIEELEQEISEEEDGELVSELNVSAPEPASLAEAEISTEPLMREVSGRVFHRRFRYIGCREVEGFPDVKLLNEKEPCGNPFTQNPGPEWVALNWGIKGSYFYSPGKFTKHTGGPTDHIECHKMNNESHWNQGLIHWHYYILPATKCVWWGHTQYGEESYAPYGRHLTPYGEWEEGVGSQDNPPAPAERHHTGLALYLWADWDEYIGKHPTICIDC
jgi:streptogramin lyase